MKKVALVLAVSLLLAGCNAKAFIEAVKKNAIKTCHFDPAITMIEAITKAVVGIDVGGAVTYICQAANSLPTAKLATRRGSIAGAPSFVLNGHRILLQGEFVK
jgi:hypothetical protein